MRFKGQHAILTLLICLGGQAVAIEAAPLVDEPISALPEQAPYIPSGMVKLGALLFAEKRLSGNRQVACTSCHDFANGGDDGLPKSVGAGGMMGTNAPTVYNSSLNFTQFWDGRSATLEDQVSIAVLSPVAMGGDWGVIVKALQSDPGYAEAFRKEFKEGITKETISRAIADFERTLITPNARFDKFLRGDALALSNREKEGYRKFKSYGCVACHQGMNVGGNMFQTMGVMGNFFKDRGLAELKPDFGRFNLTKQETDRHVFKVPSLRNVARTAPYFHDGSAPTLKGAVRTMAKYQLGRAISEEDAGLITEFLETLNGEIPASVKAAGLVPPGAQ
ncbi:MAG: c-type cytochrome [Proteobacteria bacterium]|nr:MAG: c-type cytochrome [Pseudomonadota bacterium]